MNAKSIKRKIRCSLVVGILLVSVRWVHADSWPNPIPRDFFSSNGNVVAHVTPKTETSPTRIDVFAVEGGKRRILWTAKVPSQVVPVDVMVPNNGNRVITFDNWASIGYGNYVVAIYGPQGLVRHYSLEQVFNRPEIDAQNSQEYARKIIYLSSLMDKTIKDPRLQMEKREELNFDFKIRSSTSSRWWRENSQGFFSDNETLYCLWIDWDSRWLAWFLDTGTVFPVTQEQAKVWSTKARNEILERIQKGNDDLSDYEFLGKMKVPEDKPLLAKLLNASDFRPCWSISEKIITFFSESPKRELADRILAQWEGKEPKQPTMAEPCLYHSLGSLNFKVTFPSAPRKNEGCLIAFLVPLSSQSGCQENDKPGHYVTFDLGTTYYILKGIDITPTLNFSIKGITPGKYKVKALWDKAAPFDYQKSQRVVPSKGDYVSSDEPIVNITAGKTIKGVGILCKRLVE